ncbi:MAG: AraC family transcriptional regulator [Sandaracinus sp.]|nr:AraC family transcriptional regulator [Sandaracinus sp.]MCB9617925.1 AraC family transcriptional regulator [Sandaracinus sp.]MCB9635423.1 AraC family transcriptional regulator [Sandaracinus sp.]
MDVLSDLLRAVRLSGAVFFRADFSAPWGLTSPDAEQLSQALLPNARRMVLFHYLQRGSCWVQVGGDRQELHAGDVVVLPFCDPHAMGKGAPPRVDCVSALFPSPPPWTAPPVLAYGGEGETTQIVCGFLELDDTHFNPMLTALPSLMVVRPDDSSTGVLLRSSLEFLDRELASDSPGGASMLGRLTELLFVQVLRQHVAQLPERELGWLAALRDRGIRTALELVHERPAEAWTVEALAKHAAMSRSAFAARFTELLGEAPAQYLTRWRVQLAAQRLRQTDEAIAQVASSVGYASEAAFGRAFKRELGVSPAKYRRDAKARGTGV